MPFEIPPYEPLSPDSWAWKQWFSRLTESGEWTPTFTSLTVVLGAGSVAYAGRWQKVQQIVHFIVTVTPAGGATVASTAGTTYHDLPFIPAQPGASLGADVTALTGLGTGVITTNGRNYPPSKTATTDTLVFSGSFEF